MGGVYSLALAVTDYTALAIRSVRARGASMRRRTTVTQRSSAAKSTDSEQWSPGSGALGSDKDNSKRATFAVEVKHEDGGREVSKTRKGYSTPWAVCTSKFTLIQVVFNAITSVVMSLLLFWLLFALASEGPYEWWHPNLVGVILGSVLLVSPSLVMGLAPAGMPEAIEKGWFFLVDPAETDISGMVKWMPFLADTERMKFGLLRHITLGLWLLPLFLVVPLLLAFFVVSNDDGVRARLRLSRASPASRCTSLPWCPSPPSPLRGFTPNPLPSEVIASSSHLPTFVFTAQYLQTWELIWFNIAFETVLCIPCTILGLLAFSLEYNYARVRRTMSMHPHPVTRAVRRIVSCIKLYFREGCCCACEYEKNDPPFQSLPNLAPSCSNGSQQCSGRL